MIPAGNQPRFIASAPRLGVRADEWRRQLVSIEDRGFDVVAVSEHYTGGWAMEPLTALAFAAAWTQRAWVLPLVLNNDLRHPAILAKAIATADVLSGGRIMLGLGAGWLAADYDVLGITFDAPGTRISRLSEALSIVRDFFNGSHVHHSGDHYRVDGLEALPPTTTDAGPPILVGGGGPRVLALAGSRADIVGVHVNLAVGSFSRENARELSLPQIREKIAIVHRAAAEAGRPPPVIQFTPAVVVIDGERCSAERPGFTDYIVDHPDDFADCPSVLIGNRAAVADKVNRWHEELGISLWHLGGNLDAISRVIGEVRT